MVESHGNHTNSTSRVLKTVRDLNGVRAALDGEWTRVHAVQVFKSVSAPAGANCEASRIGYGMESAGSC